MWARAHHLKHHSNPKNNYPQCNNKKTMTFFKTCNFRPNWAMMRWSWIYTWGIGRRISSKTYFQPMMIPRPIFHPLTVSQSCRHLLKNLARKWQTKEVQKDRIACFLSVYSIYICLRCSRRHNNNNNRKISRQFNNFRQEAK